MKWFILFVGIVVLCGVAALLMGYLGGGMGRATTTLSHQPLPDEGLTDAEIEQLRFDVALRGYRMSEVDAVIGRLRRELKEKDEQIAVLRADSSRALGGSDDTGPAPSALEEPPPADDVDRAVDGVDRAVAERPEAPPAG